MGAITELSTCPTVGWPSLATKPGSTICIGHEGKRLTAHDDAGGLYPGYLCYRTGTTQKNDMTVAIAEHPGNTVTTFHTLYAVELAVSDIHQAYNYAEGAYSENDPIQVVEIEDNKLYWLKVSALTLVEDTLYVPVGGTLGAPGDATPDAVTVITWGFVSLVGTGSDTLTGWAPFRCVGIVAIDTT